MIKKDLKCDIEYIIHRTHAPYKDMVDKLGLELTVKNFQVYLFQKYEDDIDGHLSEYDNQTKKIEQYYST